MRTLTKRQRKPVYLGFYRGAPETPFEMASCNFNTTPHVSAWQPKFVTGISRAVKKDPALIDVGHASCEHASRAMTSIVSKILVTNICSLLNKDSDPE